MKKFVLLALAVLALPQWLRKRWHKHRLVLARRPVRARRATRLARAPVSDVASHDRSPGAARISHTGCACAGSRSRQGRSRAQWDVVHPPSRSPLKPSGAPPTLASLRRAKQGRASAATHPVGFFNRPFGLPFGGHLRCRASQPYGPIRFSPPDAVSASPKEQRRRHGA